MGRIWLRRGRCWLRSVSGSFLFLLVTDSGMVSLLELTGFFCLAAFEIVFPEGGFCHYKEGM